MLILLPPSEGKASPTRGRPLDLEALSSPGLTAARRELLDVLTDLCATDPEAAAAETRESIAKLFAAAGI